MPHSKGSSSRLVRWRSQGACAPRASMNAVAAPDTMKSKLMRHGLISNIHGSKPGDANGLVTWKFHVTYSMPTW